MAERIHWISIDPVPFDHPSLELRGMVDSALAATPEIYAGFAAMPLLSLEEAAFLLLGFRPHQREEHENGTYLAGYERLLSRLRRDASSGEIDPNPTLSAVQAWAEKVGIAVPSQMAEEVARGRRVNAEPPQSAGPSASTESPTARRKQTDHDPELQAAADEIVRECRTKSERIPKQIVIAETIRDRRKLKISAATVARRIRKTAAI